MNNIRDAYHQWAALYDTNKNRTRDLEAAALRQVLNTISFDTCLEMGCGTGKNTAWLVTKVQQLIAVDFSAAMLAKAREKITSPRVTFLEADMLSDWHFTHNRRFDLVTFSLVLEHIPNLNIIFEKLRDAVNAGGYVYIGELHPFKQYLGSQARFETEEGIHMVTAYTHHVSDFIRSALAHGFDIVDLREWFDEDDAGAPPRILTILLKKQTDNTVLKHTAQVSG